MKETKEIKVPISDEIVLRNMLIVVYGVSAVFFIKNLVSADFLASGVIAGTVAFFTFLIFMMKKKHVGAEILQITVCLSIVFLVFIISLFSGNFYSDDFPMYLAVIALSGLYLVPRYTIIQMVVIDILMMIAYYIHPQKADPFSQYLMCLFILNVCTICFYMVIKRGRAYIVMGEIRAKEAEALLGELKEAGNQLQDSCSRSVSRISKLEKVNIHLENGVSDLWEGSTLISRDAANVNETFHQIREKMATTQEQVNALDTEVENVESSISVSKKNMKEVVEDIGQLKEVMDETVEVFHTLQQEIMSIVSYTKELNKIATNTTTLALNASIEAARAGQFGAGFSVVANKVQMLSEDSNQCSARIAKVVAAMETLVQESTKRIEESDQAIQHSIEKLDGFERNFKELTKSFKNLHENIGEQNENIYMVDNSLGNLENKIQDMEESSRKNQDCVSSLTESIDVYKESIQKIIDDNMLINELSDSLLGKQNIKN